MLQTFGSRIDVRTRRVRYARCRQALTLLPTLGAAFQGPGSKAFNLRRDSTHGMYPRIER